MEYALLNREVVVPMFEKVRETSRTISPVWILIVLKRLLVS